MGRSLLGVVLLLVALSARADERVPISEVLESLLNEVGRSGQAGEGPGCSMAVATDNRFIRRPARFQAEDCRPLSWEKVCARAAKGYPGSGWEGLPSSQEKRFPDLSLRRRVFELAYRTFRRMRDDPRLVARCCSGAAAAGGNEGECRRYFSGTELSMDLGLGPHKQAGEFYSPFDGWSGSFTRKGGSVVVSEAILLNCKTEQCVEWLLFHELSHACQLSVWAAAPGATENWWYSERKASKEASRSELRRRFGAAGDCVIRELDEAARSRVRRLRRTYPGRAAAEIAHVGQWYREALANLIFLPLWTEPAHFSWLCHADEDLKHGPAKAYMPCALQIPDLRRAICGDVN